MNLALGTVQFGLPYGISNQTGQISFDEAKNIIQFSRENGIYCLDTAIAYGSSEEVLGRIGVKDFQVISKLPEISTISENKKRWILDSVQQSLKRLKIPKLYALLLHKSNDLCGSFQNEILDAVTELKSLGLIHKFGISIYQPNELDLVFDPSKIEIIQSPLNVFDRTLINSGWLKRLKSYGSEIHIRSIFLQGLLLMDDIKRPDKFNRWNSLWMKWNHFLDQYKISPMDACLGYAKSVQGVDQVVVGVDSRSQLQDIIAKFNQIQSIEFPGDLFSNDPNLINPSLWSQF